VASRLKSEFSTSVPLTVHWDGKLMEDLTGKEHVNRVPVLISGVGVEQLIGVPKLASGTRVVQEQQSLPAYNIGISWIEWWPFAFKKQRQKQVSTQVLAQ